MKQIIIIFLLVGLGLLACKNKRENFSVYGEIANSADKKIYLRELSSKGKTNVDSIIINSKGNFVLQGKTTIPAFYGLYLGDKNFANLIIYPGDKIKIIDDDGNFMNTYSVKGSDESERIAEITTFINKQIKKVDSLGLIYLENKENPDILKVKQGLDSCFFQLLANSEQYLIKMVNQNPSSLSSLFAVYQKITAHSYVLDWKKHFLLYRNLDSCLQLKYPEIEAVATFHKQFIESKNYLVQKEQNEKALQPGNKVPEICIPDAKGKLICLSSLIGKNVLLYFWASWNEESRELNKKLQSIYSKYNTSRFEIYQVSLDSKKEIWQKAILADQLNGIQVSDLKYWDSVVVPLFHLSRIPVLLLIDKKGNIVGMPTNIEELEKLLKTIK